MILLGTEFREALLAELKLAENTLPYGGEQVFLKQVRDLINNPQYNFFIPNSTEESKENHTQLLRSVAMTKALVKLCQLNSPEWGDHSKGVASNDAPGWGRSISSWAYSRSGTVSPSVQKAVLKVLADARFDKPGLEASDLNGGDLAADLLEQPEYKNNPNNQSNQLLQKFWSEQLQLKTAEENCKPIFNPGTRPFERINSLTEAAHRKSAQIYQDQQRKVREQERAQFLKDQAEVLEKGKAVFEEIKALNIPKSEAPTPANSDALNSLSIEMASINGYTHHYDYDDNDNDDIPALESVPCSPLFIAPPINFNTNFLQRYKNTQSYVQLLGVRPETSKSLFQPLLKKQFSDKTLSDLCKTIVVEPNYDSNSNANTESKKGLRQLTSPPIKLRKL